jgi:prepilin-type N-terminal cleavage/methylation domain-containing protein
MKESRGQEIRIKHYGSKGRKQDKIPKNLSFFSSRGFTLIEMIVFIIIAGIFLPLTFVAFSGALKESMNPENITANRLAAEQVIELTAKQIAIAFPTGSVGTTPCSGISNCTITEAYQTFSGGAFSNSGSATNYVLITVAVNGFTANTLVTKHEYP